MYSVDFLPNMGAGQIKLSSLRNEVRALLGTHKEFKKTKFSKNTTDNFSFCHVFYDDQDKVEAVEFFNETEFLFKDKNLFSFSFAELKSFLESNSVNFEGEASGLRSDAIGLSVYSPDEQRIETILVYRRGYYD